ncbi:MAG: hypothetical protein A2W03_17060 [Candidatus Aminicenantes bacterium RBG_16_63_16]|nr:MAG: hypothetical protein A2W03_17060 [Candidatus Aminicenantes bacterium RBG_16_63_16]
MPAKCSADSLTTEGIGFPRLHAFQVKIDVDAFARIFRVVQYITLATANLHSGQEDTREAGSVVP